MDDPIGADDERDRDRQSPIIGAVRHRRIPSGADHHVLHLVIDGKREAEGHRIAVVRVGENRKRGSRRRRWSNRSEFLRRG